MDKLCLSSEKLGNIDLILETSEGKAFNLCAEEEVTLSPCEKVRVKLKEKGGEWSQERGNAESVLMVSQLDDSCSQFSNCYPPPPQRVLRVTKSPVVIIVSDDEEAGPSGT